MSSILLFVRRNDLSCTMSFNAENTRSLTAEETGVAKMRAATAKSVGSVFLRSSQNFFTV